MSLHPLLRDDRGSAGVEFALILPLLVILLFISFEAGNFVWQQHKLTEAVRDGARFASRMNIADLCNGQSAKDPNDPVLAAATATIEFYTRTGQLPSGDQQVDGSVPPRVWNWAADGVTFDPGCGGFPYSTGLYSALTDSEGHAVQNGPLATVSGNVTYRSLFRTLGFDTRGIVLRAESRAAVIGI